MAQNEGNHSGDNYCHVTKVLKAVKMEKCRCEGTHSWELADIEVDTKLGGKALG